MQPYEKLTFEEIRFMEWRDPELQCQDFHKMHFHQIILKSPPPNPLAMDMVSPKADFKGMQDIS